MVSWLRGTRGEGGDKEEEEGEGEVVVWSSRNSISLASASESSNQTVPRSAGLEAWFWISVV